MVAWPQVLGWNIMVAGARGRGFLHLMVDRILRGKKGPGTTSKSMPLGPTFSK
jgi:hypothetical protein